MKPTNEILFDKLIKHNAYLLRLVSKQSDDFIAALTKNNPKLAAFLIENIDDLSMANTAGAQVKWRKFENALKSVRADAIDEFIKGYDADSIKAIENETKYMKALYQNSVGIAEISFAIPKLDAVNLLYYGPIDGKTVSSYFGELKYGDVDRMISHIRAGLIEQKPRYKIVNEIIGNKEFQYTDGITQITRNNARSVVRTVTQGIVNGAREEFYKANSEYVKRERYTAVLDGRTTVECLSLDGEVFPLTEGPRPPLHRNCRSIRIAMIDGAELLGNRPTITDTRTRRVREIDFRKEAKAAAGAKKWKSLTEKQRRGLITNQRNAWAEKNIGRIPAKTSGSQWLKTADKSFQDDFLGKKQAELFRSGQLELNKFVDASGKKLSVSELYRMYADEFKKAGIKP